MAGAYILAGELRRSMNDYQQAFQEYETKLRAFVERKQRAAERFAGSFAPATQFGLSLRDLVVRAAACCLPLGKWLIRKMVGDSLRLPDYSI